MSRVRRHFLAILIGLASLLVAAGCVSVPTSGPIEIVEGQQPGCQNCLNVEVAPPIRGATPKEIVEGYLLATSYYQPNYSVARQFLSQVAAEKWKPEEGATIYTGSVMATEGDESVVRLTGRHLGSLGPDRTYTAHDAALRRDFHLKKDDNGEWRIDRLPPDGLMVDKVYFDRFYQSYDLYFIGNGSSLVPNPIHIPALRNPANVASALVKALLNGPSVWLTPAVSTAIPPNTSLSVDSVTITNGIAEVPLSDSVLALPDEQRSFLAAQIVYTLRQVVGVKGVLIKVNQQPYRVPESDPNSLVIAVDAIPEAMDPIPLGAGDQMYAVAAGVVKEVTAAADSPSLKDLRGPLGRELGPINALAVSVTNTDLAVTTNDRTALHHALITADPPTEVQPPPPLLSGVNELLRPQFTRYGEIWDIGREGGQQRMWMFTVVGDKIREFPVESSLLGEVTAFKISPDGSRIALVRTSDGRSELGLATIIRSDKITVGDWRPLRTGQPNRASMARISDVAWLNATELLVLGAGEGETANTPLRISQDASLVTAQGAIENGNAVQLAVSPTRQAAIIVGDKGQTWKADGTQWSPFLKDKVSTIAYPG